MRKKSWQFAMDRDLGAWGEYPLLATHALNLTPDRSRIMTDEIAQ
jgi:hypothetical protein